MTREIQTGVRLLVCRSLSGTYLYVCIYSFIGISERDHVVASVLSAGWTHVNIAHMCMSVGIKTRTRSKKSVTRITMAKASSRASEAVYAWAVGLGDANNNVVSRNLQPSCFALREFDKCTDLDKIEVGRSNKLEALCAKE